MALNYNSISGNYVIGKCIVFMVDPDTGELVESGESEKVEITPTFERDDLKGNRNAVSRIVDSMITDTDVKISFTFHQHTNLNRALSVGGSNGLMNVTSGTGLTKTFTDVKNGTTHWLGLDVASVVVTDGEDPLTLNVDYTVDLNVGLIQFKTTQATAVVTYNRTAVPESAGRLQTGIGGNGDFRREIIIVGVNKGPKPFIRLWDVRLSPSGARSLAGADRTKFDIEGTCIANDARALEYGDREEYAFGVEQTLLD